MAEPAAAARSLARGRAELEGRVRVTSVAAVLLARPLPRRSAACAPSTRVASVDLVADDHRRASSAARPTSPFVLPVPSRIALARRIGTLRFTLAARRPRTCDDRHGEGARQGPAATRSL
ncbi:MAG: hypothetical protein R3D02_02075 [Hyphomicrobiales bacterium]